MTDDDDGDRIAACIISFIKIHQRTTASRVLGYVRVNYSRQASKQVVAKRLQIMADQGILMKAGETGAAVRIYLLDPDWLAKQDNGEA